MARSSDRLPAATMSGLAAPLLIAIDRPACTWRISSGAWVFREMQAVTLRSHRGSAKSGFITSPAAASFDKLRTNGLTTFVVSVSNHECKL